MASLDAKAVKVGWQRSYKVALDADVWGQADEAQSSYLSLAQAVMDLLPPSPPQGRTQRPPSLFSAEEVTSLLRFHHCLTCRAEVLSFNMGVILDGLQGEGGEDGGHGREGSGDGRGGRRQRRRTAVEDGATELSLDDMKRLTPVLDDLFTGSTSPFPLVLSPQTVGRLTANAGRSPSIAENVISVHDDKATAEGEAADDGRHSLQPEGSAPSHIALHSAFTDPQLCPSRLCVRLRCCGV